jgi:hypothetical protein
LVTNVHVDEIVLRNIVPKCSHFYKKLFMQLNISS